MKKRIPVRHIVATLKEPDFSGNFSIRDIHNLLAGMDMVQELHRHDFFYVLAVQKGKGVHEIDFTSYAVSDNSVFFMLPGQVHQLRLEAGSTGYLIQFGAEFYFSQNTGSNNLLRKASDINHYQLTHDSFEKLFIILSEIFQEYTTQQNRYQEVINAGMEIFFVKLLRHAGGNIQPHSNPYTQERLDELLALIEANMLTHKQVSQYAVMLNLSAYQVNAITKAILGKTCSELINDYVILEAKRQLLATSVQVNQIADHLGYEDVSYFIRFFKKHTGYSPETFRHNFT